MDSTEEKSYVKKRYFTFQNTVINSHVIKVCIKSLLPLLLLLFGQPSFAFAVSNLGRQWEVCYLCNTPSLHNPIQMHTGQAQAAGDL